MPLDRGLAFGVLAFLAASLTMHPLMIPEVAAAFLDHARPVSLQRSVSLQRISRNDTVSFSTQALRRLRPYALDSGLPRPVSGRNSKSNCRTPVPLS